MIKTVQATLPEAAQEEGMDQSPFLIISGHDYRSKRQSSVHFIARELLKTGACRFFSVGFSPLSLIKHDPRASLWSRANQIETYNGVECYLWRTAMPHPVNLNRLGLSSVEKTWFTAYIRQAPRVLKDWIAGAKTIILESGMPVAFFDLIKKINPLATVDYLCSDALDTIGCAHFLTDELHRVAQLFDYIKVCSPKLVSEFPGTKDNIVFIPHGMDPLSSDASMPNPYEKGINLVSVGSMLFDPTFFEIAAKAFPDYTFHVIGGGRSAERLSGPNIRVYGEMPYKQTLAYLKHADVGIAPYQGHKVPAYLVDTSLKLMQFRAFGVPAVCPYLTAGDRKGRFGYQPENRDSIAGAINAALASGRFPGVAPLTWEEVAARVIDPKKFADTAIR